MTLDWCFKARDVMLVVMGLSWFELPERTNSRDRKRRKRRMKTKAGLKRLLVLEEALSPCGGVVRGKLTHCTKSSSCAVPGRLSTLGKITKMEHKAVVPATLLAGLLLMCVTLWSCVSGVRLFWLAVIPETEHRFDPHRWPGRRHRWHGEFVLFRYFSSEKIIWAEFLSRHAK